MSRNMRTDPTGSFHSVLTAAVRDISENGYDDPSRLDAWVQRLREAAIADSPSPAELTRRMQDAMQAIYRRMVDRGGILKYHPDMDWLTLTQVAPELRHELNRRILASADLIKLNRERSIERTLQRFTGWSTSIPPGGSRIVDRREVKKHIAKTLRQMTYEERRVAIDQGHKLIGNINAVIAEHNQAIAMKWRSHWRQPGYNYRPDHKERDQKFYALRNSWAIEQGLIDKGAGYADEMTAPHEEPFCRCYGVYYQNLRDLPDDMLTAKGKRVLAETRIAA